MVGLLGEESNQKPKKMTEGMKKLLRIKELMNQARAEAETPANNTNTGTVSQPKQSDLFKQVEPFNVPHSSTMQGYGMTRQQLLMVDKEKILEM